MTDDRSKARQLAYEYLSKGDPIGWFEEFYSHAKGDSSAISWADMKPNPNLTGWLAKQQITGQGKKALVVGCGLGDDAEALAKAGFEVTAFDVSPTAVAWCQQRFLASRVYYVVADILQPPPAWQGKFDFVLEVYTLQVLPATLRGQAITQMAQLLAPNGTMLVIARGRQPEEPEGTMPMPLTRDELGAFTATGLQEVQFEDYMDGEDSQVRRFRVEYRA